MEDKKDIVLNEEDKSFLTSFKTYKSVKDLEIDDLKLELLSKKLGYSLSSATLCLPLGIHLLKERKRLVGLSFNEKKQLLFLKSFNAVKKKKIKRQLGLE